MKFEDLKVGMKVRAIDNNYSITNKTNEWVGEVLSITCGRFTAKTISTKNNICPKGYQYDRLRPEKFEPVVKEKKIVAMNEIPLKVTYDRDNIYVIYKDKIVAKATCRKDDNFNEEFGLNLALRRFCKTLCNENTTKKIIYNIDKVEDFI